MSQLVELSSIHESPTNPRKRFSDLGELAASIKNFGVLQPILIRPNDDGFECVFGHRRLRAARQAGLAEIPAQVRELSDREVIEAQFAENVQREDIHPLEEGDAYRHVIDAGIMTIEDLVAKVGRSKTYIHTRLRFADLVEPARKAFIEGDLTPAVAMVLTRVHVDRQEDALKLLLERKKQLDKWGDPFTAADAVNELLAFTHALKDAPFQVKDAELIPAAGPCVTCPKRSGQQRELFGNISSDTTDTCTDPECWREKVAMHWAQAQEKARKRGLEILDAEKVFKGGSKVKGGYVDAKAKPNFLDWDDKRTWKGLVGRGLKPAVAQNPVTGQVMEVLKAKDAKEALPEDIKKKLKRKKASRPAPSIYSGPDIDYSELDSRTKQRYAAQMLPVAKSMSDGEMLDTIARGEVGGMPGAELVGFGLIESTAQKGGYNPAPKAEREQALKVMTSEHARAIVLALCEDRATRSVMGLKGEWQLRSVVRKEMTAEAKKKAKPKKRPAKKKKATKKKASKK